MSNTTRIQINKPHYYQGSYSYSRCSGGGWGIFKKESDVSFQKIAEVCQRGEDGRQIAGQMITALNARERYLNKLADKE